MHYGTLETIARRHRLTLVYLFGSQAEKGKRYLDGKRLRSDSSSDLDIAVAFEEPPARPMETYGLIYREMSKIFEPFEIDLVFIHEVDSLFQYEIIRGIRIFEKNERIADEFEEGTMKRSEDLLFKKSILEREIMEAVTDGYFELEYRPNPRPRPVYRNLSSGT